jgi:hypothetical protein
MRLSRDKVAPDVIGARRFHLWRELYQLAVANFNGHGHVDDALFNSRTVGNKLVTFLLIAMPSPSFHALGL